jgi:hypothetical protein
MSNDLKELGGRDPHAVLGVGEGVSKQEVAKAYRRIAAHGVHPDAGGNEQTFRQLTRARDILMDSGRLADYTAARDGNGFAHAGSEPDAPRAHPSASTRSAQARPHQSPGPPVRGKVHPLLVVALLFAFAGPLLWPLAIVIGLFGLWRTNRSG